jgi:DNA replication protein DnaC
MSLKMNEITEELTPEIVARFATAREKIKAEKEKQRPSNSFMGALPPGLILRIHEAKNRQRTKPVKETIQIDDRGRAFVSPKALRELQDQAAIDKHGNDPNKRLDDCGFPANRKDREFILKHNFGKILKECLKQIRNKKWLYAHGQVGCGKTTLMTRIVWELIKDRPTSRASFISVNDYIRESVRRESLVQVALRKGEEIDPDTGGAALRRLVLLDDLDKFNWRNDYNIYCLLSLIEKLKDNRAWVLITAQYSITELLARHGKKEDVSPLCDRLRQMCYVLPVFSGRSLR